MEILIVWEGYDESDATWEPVGNFIHQYYSEVGKYCQYHDVDPDVLSELSPEPHEASLSQVKLAFGTWKSEDPAICKEWVTKIVEHFGEGVSGCDSFVNLEKIQLPIGWG